MPLPADYCVITSPFGKTVNFQTPLDTNVVKGKVALITGAASGLGLALAEALAEAGAHVAIADVQEGLGKDLEQELTSKGQSGKFFQVDTTSWDSQAALFKSVLAWKDGLDIVVAAAGVGATDIRKFIEDDSKEPVQPPLRTLEVNLIGVYYTAYLTLFYYNKLVSKHSDLQPQLLLVSSLAGYGVTLSSADYNTSKHGVRAFWKSIRGSASKYGGAQTNLLAPTYIDTPMTAAGVPLLREGGAKVGTADDFVAAALQAICDSRVDGRAICVVSGEGKPGSLNFDLEDDAPGGDGSEQFRLKRKDGVFGEMFV